MKTIFVTILFCVLMVGCTSKPGQNPAVDSINNSVGINDTLGLSLHPEYPGLFYQEETDNFCIG